MRPFSLLVKPVGGACNLACRYCFYRGHPGGTIPRRILARALEGYCALPFAGKSIAFQGGEPLLSPDYVFDEAERCEAELSVQTNATLMTSAAAERFAAGRWLVGVSIDGPARLHDAVRCASFREAERGVRMLEAAGAEYNLLVVVSKANVCCAEETYRFLRDNFATRYHQYIECTGPDPSLAITGDEWGEFLVRLFDEWMADGRGGVSIRNFESLASSIVRGHPSMCSCARDCRHHLVLEHDGSVYPCDFNVRDDLRLGNIETHTWEEMAQSGKYAAFAASKTASLPDACRECEYLDFCNGDCPRNRRTTCSGLKRFFGHAASPLAARVLF